MNIPARGFLLPIVLVLLLAAALLAAGALSGASVEQALANAARARQLAFEAAEFGLAHGQSVLRSGRPMPGTERIAVPPDDAALATVSTELMFADALPEGFSTSRVVAYRYRVRSTGEARKARLSLEAGFTRLEPTP